MDPEISLEDLTQQVSQYFHVHSRRYGLLADSVTVRYILNWGGFVNASFTVEDGKRAYHLKLADDEDAIAGLERWYELRETLESCYQAPKIVAWVEMEALPIEGLLFEHFTGSQAHFIQNPTFHRQVIALVARLHADQELADALVEIDGPPGDCADYFISIYIDRFDEDLLIVARDLPPFVSLDTLDWMQGETRHLEALARELPCFSLPAGSPTHGDLWENNILLNEQGEWVVLDWDDLSLGDPALEYSILLSGLWRQDPTQGLSVASLLPESVQADGALRDRIAVCLQAFLLDQVIDTLADYVEADFAPEHLEQVKAEKKRLHLSALSLYRQFY